MRHVDWLRYGPFHVQLVVIRRCNLACGYCNEFDDHSDAIPTEILKQRIDKIRELGTLAIEFTGGEPLLHPDIVELIVTLSAVVGAAPPSEVREVIDYAEANGFRPRVLLIHDGDGQFKLSPENHDLYREIEQRLGRRMRQAHNYRTRLLETGKAPFKCRAGSRYLYVDEFGKVRWCSQTREFWGKDLMDYGIDDLREQFETVKTCNESCTVGCVRNNSKIDEWRPQKKAFVSSVRRLPVL